jgi:hypothetical protein
MAEKLSTGMSNKRLRGVLMGHEKLLLLDSEAKALAPRVKSCRVKLKETERALEDAVDEEAALTYVALACDAQGDLETKTFADEMYNACGRSRGAARFKAAFPKGQADVTQPRLFEQRDKLNEYLITWTEVAKKDDLVTAWLPRMTKASDDQTTALDAMVAGAKAVATAEVAERMARLEAVALWDSNYGELYQMFPGNRPRVEFFFPALRSQSRSAGEGDEGPTPPTPPSPSEPSEPTT